jgi:hypothetical protein
MARCVRANDEAAKRVPDEHASLSGGDVHEHCIEFVDNSSKCPRTRGDVAPAEARASSELPAPV